MISDCHYYREKGCGGRGAGCEYDNVIDTTGSEEDSTFAAIDMGEAYLAMGTGMKSTVNCKNNQFLFDSRKAFEINREYLINELLKLNKANASLDPIMRSLKIKKLQLYIKTFQILFIQ